MGYFRGWSNFEEWYYYSGTNRDGEGYKKFICKWCGGEIKQPKSENQKYHSRDEDPACDDDRYFDGLWQKGKHPLQKNEL